MSNNRFTDHLTVEAVGNLAPSRIGSEACEHCENNKNGGPGVLLEGVTPEAVRLLYQQCELHPEGTAETIKQLREANAELAKATEDLMYAVVCYFNWDEEDELTEDDGMLYFVKEYFAAKAAVQKAREVIARRLWKMKNHVRG